MTPAQGTSDAAPAGATSDAAPDAGIVASDTAVGDGAKADDAEANALPPWKSPEETGALQPVPNHCLDGTSSVYGAWMRAVTTGSDGAWMLLALRMAETNGESLPRAIGILESLRGRASNAGFSDILDYHLGRMWAAQARRVEGDEARDALGKAQSHFAAVVAVESSPYLPMARAEGLLAAIALGEYPRDELDAFIRDYPRYPAILAMRFDRARLGIEHGDATAVREMQDLAWLNPWSDVSQKAQDYMRERGIDGRDRSYEEELARVNELRRMRFWDEAEAAAQEAVKRFPDRMPLAVQHARIPYERSDHAEAVRRFEAILKRLDGEVRDGVRPQSMIAYIYRAYGYLGNREKALEYNARNAKRLAAKDRASFVMEFALTCGALDVAWKHAQTVYENATSATDVARFGFIAYLNGEYAFARQKFAEAEKGLSGAFRRRALYFLAMATLKAATEPPKPVEKADDKADKSNKKDGKKDKKKDKKSNKKDAKKTPAVTLPPPTEARAIALFKDLIAADSGDYYAILAFTRLAEIERQKSGAAAPATPVLQDFGEVVQAPVPPRPWEQEFTYDEKAPLAHFAEDVEKYREMLPDLDRVRFLHEAELYRERNALFRRIAIEVMGITKLAKRPTVQNLWTSGMNLDSHLVDNRGKKSGFWGTSVKREAFPMPPKSDTAARQALAARQQAIYDHASELRAFVRNTLAAFHDYYLARRYSPSLKQTCGSPQNLDDCSTMYPHAYSRAVLSAARENRISPDLVWTLMNIESAFNPDSISVAEAYGLLQIIPVTGYKLAKALHVANFGPYELIQPEYSIRMGTWYFAQVLHKFHGYATLSMAGYNGGPHQVARWLTAYGGRMEHDAFIELIPLSEARNYVKKGMARMLIFYRLDRHDPKAFFEIPNTLPDGFEVMPNY